MTPSHETWLIERLREGAATLQPPSDLADVVADRALAPQATKRSAARSWGPLVAVVVVVAMGVVGVSALRNSTTTAQPAAAPTQLKAAPPESGVPTAILGTWRLVAWDGERLPPSKEMPEGPLVTFNIDGTWSGSDVCNSVEGTYRVDGEASFSATTEPTRLRLCGGVENFLLPAGNAVSVAVFRNLAFFMDASGEQVAKYRRPGGDYGAEAKLVTRDGEPALSLGTYGSGSCPTRIESISVESSNQLLVNLADPALGYCTTDFKWSTDVMTIPGDLDLGAPVTAKLVGANPPFITLLVNTSALSTEPVLVTAKEWDGTSVDQARLEGTLGVNDKGCVTVGDTVVMWPNTYQLGWDKAGTWVIVVTGDANAGPGYGTVLAEEGEDGSPRWWFDAVRREPRTTTWRDSLRMSPGRRLLDRRHPSAG